MKRTALGIVALLGLIVGAVVYAQAPPQNGVYTFQGQGNLAAILSTLGNPQLDQIPFGNGVLGYTLAVPSGDIDLTSIGNFHVLGDHYATQNCSTSPCTVTSAIVNCNASGGPITLQLPGANGTGFWSWITKTDNSPFLCTVAAAGSDTINGLSTFPLNQQYQSALIDDQATGSWLAGSPATTSSGGFSINGTVDFHHYSAVNINDAAFAPLSAPTPTITATCSGTCATTYTYELACLGDNSSTTAASSGVTSINASSLSATNNNVVSWTAEVGCYSGYQVYGRIGGSLGLLATIPYGTNSYTDTGTVSPGAVPPTTNTTGSILAANIIGANIIGTPTITLQSNATNSPIVQILGASGQSADLFEAKKGATTEFKIDQNGNATATGTLAGNALNLINGSNSAALEAQPSGTPSPVFLPSTNGANLSVLTNNGSQVASWVLPAVGGDFNNFGCTTGAISTSGNTTVSTSGAQTVPANGGNYRAFVQYFIPFLQGVATGGADCLATDGTATFLASEISLPGANATGAGIASGLSSATYAAGASVTISVACRGSGAGGATTTVESTSNWGQANGCGMMVGFIPTN